MALVCVLISGSRKFNDQALFNAELDRLLAPLIEKGHEFCFIHGGASGADTLTEHYPRALGRTRCFPANWNKYGKRAGSIRNQLMLDSALAWRAKYHVTHVVLVAFPTKDSIGTRHMIHICKLAGIPVRVKEV